jgi:hypothetical protein
VRHRSALDRRVSVEIRTCRLLPLGDVLGFFGPCRIPPVLNRLLLYDIVRGGMLISQEMGRLCRVCCNVYIVSDLNGMGTGEV